MKIQNLQQKDGWYTIDSKTRGVYSPDDELSFYEFNDMNF